MKFNTLDSVLLISTADILLKFCAHFLIEQTCNYADAL